MTQPTSRTTFKDYCKRKLGHPVVELNLDDDQIEDAIDDAVQYFQEYHYDGTHPEFVKKQINLMRGIFFLIFNLDLVFGLKKSKNKKK